MKNEQFKPESLMMTYGHRPEEAQGAVKSPLYQTSTFSFPTAEEGKAFFEVAYGLREPREGEEQGFIYSRINNPNLNLLEQRLALWDRAEACASFNSGMAAISTVLLEFLKPGDLLVFSNPVYGGTDHFIRSFLNQIGVHTLGIMPEESMESVASRIQESGLGSRLAMLYLETPGNPTNALTDIRAYSDLIRQFNPGALVAVDNTYLGPVWQHPLKHGADLVIYSATKYIAGHSDVIAGAVSGSESLIQRVKTLRTFLGNMPSPQTAWLLQRSLETLKVRVDRQTTNAQIVAHYLDHHPKIEKVCYLGLLTKGTPAYKIFQKQCEGPGAMLSFYIKGGEQEAFQFLNALKLVKLAVSLGSTESLVQHPKTMTHAGVAEELRQQLNINDALIRLSVGIENEQDLISDLEQALEQVGTLTSNRPELAKSQ